MVTKLRFIKSTKSVSGFGCFVQKSGNALKTLEYLRVENPVENVDNSQQRQAG
jgi:hypothetical protein